MNRLYYGDNLDVLKEHIADSTVQLVYLDPPFNSKRDYNLIFKSPKGEESAAQIEAFLDTWHWSEQSEREFADILRQSNTQVSAIIESLRRFLGETDLMAYLVMMASRLLELSRVLKPEGSLYLHCDPVASHYLKILLDCVFTPKQFRNEITWKRTTSHNDSSRFGANTDIILFYTKSNQFLFNTVYQAYDTEYLKRFRDPDSEGRLWTDDNLTAKGLSGGGYEYEYKGVTSLWRCPIETMQRLDKEGRLHFTSAGGIRVKKYLDELPGLPCQSLWDDINPINSQSKERLGYPTQKPLALLERIIQASSNEGDIILDPFCGCGTAVHAAQKLGRAWIGIDITHLAISLIEKRLYDAFPEIQFTVEGTPKDLDSARDLANRDKYQFQWWACSLVNAQPYQGKKKGADGGIDGISYFVDADLKTGKPIHRKAIMSVKGGQSVGLTMLKDLIATVDSNQADIGLFITLAEPTEPMRKEALKAGFFTPSYNQQKQVPKIQILTIEGLLNKTHQPQIPDMSIGGLNFKKAQQEAPNHNQQTLF